jgi:uncharacterized membrane protein (UPF0127 family)
MSAVAPFPRARRPLLAGTLALLFLFLFGVFGAALAATIERLEIVTRNGVQVFEVEIAATNEERARGLMFRRELPEGRGMLFDFALEGPITMWMKNTHVSLDMIFIRADGTIARIAENTEPLSEAHIVSGAPVKAVLEVVAGTAKRLGIAPGDRVAHRIFKRR